MQNGARFGQNRYHYDDPPLVELEVDGEILSADLDTIEDIEAIEITDAGPQPWRPPDLGLLGSIIGLVFELLLLLLTNLGWLLLSVLRLVRWWLGEAAGLFQAHHLRTKDRTNRRGIVRREETTIYHHKRTTYHD